MITYTATVFEAEPIASTIREAGSGGVLKYRNLLESDLDNKDLVVGTLERIDRVKKKMYIQTKSYDEVLDLARNKEEYYAAMPCHSASFELKSCEDFLPVLGED